MVRAPGDEHQVVVHLLEGGRVDALEQRDPVAERLLEVQLAGHGRGGDALDLRELAGVLGEHLDDLALDQRRVHVEHDQAHPAPHQVGRLDGDVDALDGGLGGEQGAEPLGVGAGDVQVDRRDGVAGHPLDAVDVGAAVGDPTGDRGHVAGPERRTDDGDVGATLAAHLVVAHAAIDVDGHVEGGAGRLHGGPEPLPVTGRRDQDAQDQPAPEHDLLDVEHLDAGVGERLEDRRRHARPVLAAQRDEQGLLCVLVHDGNEASAFVTAP